jgi:hypothetical protein
MSRRTLIKYGSLAAGAVVATPTILTLGATPASASGTPSSKFAGVDDTSGSTQSTQTIAAAGLWVVAFAVRANASGSHHVATINTPAGWTQIGSQWGSIGTSSTAPALNARCTMALFYRYYATNPGSTNQVTFSHNGTAGAFRAFTGYNFPRGTVENSNLSAAAFSSNNSASAGPVTTLVKDSKYLYFSVVTGSGTPAFTAPVGYSGTSSNITAMGIGAAVSSVYIPAAANSGSVTGTWSGTASNKLGAIIAIA